MEIKLYNTATSLQSANSLNPYYLKYLNEYENEIYTIKDSNQKRLSDLMKVVRDRGETPKILLGNNTKEHNKKLVDSLRDVGDLFYKVMNLRKSKENYIKGLEDKYQEFKKYSKKMTRKENRQKIWR